MPDIAISPKVGFNRRLLLVEDQPEWSSALAEMYRKLLPLKADIIVESNPHKAIELLQPRAFDLISVDMNLMSRGISGLTVLSKAASRAAAYGAIVVTGIANDETFMDHVEDNTSYRSALSGLQEIVEKSFPPGSSQVLTKAKGLTIPQSIIEFEKKLSKEKLDFLAGPLPPYRVELREPVVSSGIPTPTIWIQSLAVRPNRIGHEVAVEPRDFKLFYELLLLAKKTRSDGAGRSPRWWVTPEELLAAYDSPDDIESVRKSDRLEKTARIRFDSLVDRLRKCAIRTDALLQWLTEPKGCKLMDDVERGLPDDYLDSESDWELEEGRPQAMSSRRPRTDEQMTYLRNNSSYSDIRDTEEDLLSKIEDESTDPDEGRHDQ